MERYNHPVAGLLGRLLDVIETDIAPLTRAGVMRGNKLFGAAILRKSDLSLVLAETNNEIENPLWHGEMHALKRFYELPAEARPDPRECLFLSTHEPCSLCLSAITWAGFDNFHYLFTHADSRDSFSIPHDIRILREVFAVPDPGKNEAAPDRPLYNPTNPFWQSHGIARAIGTLDQSNRTALGARVAAITALYAELSEIYQKSKGKAGIPLA